MSQLHPFEENVAAAWSPQDWSELSVLIAVSGGPDSVALLRAMHALKAGRPGRLVVAHFNHRMRPIESDNDEQFVRQLADELGLQCEVGYAESESPGAGALSAESAARAARYWFLQSAAERLGARYVATAHTADDQAETILHRVIRGTGLPGLAGIPRVRDLGSAVTLIRPLLRVRRTEIHAYLTDLRQSARTDHTNQELRYTRNRLRHELLPELAQKYNPAVVEALLRLGELAADTQRALDAALDPLLDQAVRWPGQGTVVIACHRLAGQQRHLVRQLFTAIWRRAGWPLQAMGFDQWDRLAELATNATARERQMFPGNIMAQKQGAELTLARLANGPSD